MHGCFLQKIKTLLKIPMLFKKSNRKPYKIWLDKGSEFYNRSMKSWLENEEMYLTYNEGKSVVVERFIRTLKNKICKYIKKYQKMCIWIN